MIALQPRDFPALPAEKNARASFNQELEARVLAAQIGDEGALQSLLDQFRPLLRSRMHRLFTALQETLSGTDWDDVESQVTLIFLTRLHSFDASAGVFFPHYMERMLDLDGRAWLRAQRRDNALPFSQLALPREESADIEDWAELPPALGETHTGGIEERDQVERTLALRAALDELPTAQREVVWGCCVLGKTETRVAEELGLSRSTVRNRLESALSQMRAYFEMSGEVAPSQDTRTGRARPQKLASHKTQTSTSSPFERFWTQISIMAKDEKRPDLVGVGAGRPVLMQGTFDFPATGLKTPQLLSPKLSYIVPIGSVAGVRYLRVGVVCDQMVVISTVVNGLPHRLVPVPANQAAHVSFAIVEPIVAGSQIEIHVASDAPGTVIVDVGVLQMPV